MTNVSQKDWDQALTLKIKMTFPTIPARTHHVFKLNPLIFHPDPLEGTSLNQAIPEITSEIIQKQQQQKKTPVVVVSNLKNSQPPFF